MTSSCIAQVSPSVTHKPYSAIENGRGSNTEFYREDELKFHGGGIGTSFDGRGSLSANTIDFTLRQNETVPTRCTTSTLGDPRFQCQRTVSGQELRMMGWLSFVFWGLTEKRKFQMPSCGSVAA